MYKFHLKYLRINILEEHSRFQLHLDSCTIFSDNVIFIMIFSKRDHISSEDSINTEIAFRSWINDVVYGFIMFYLLIN